MRRIPVKTMFLLVGLGAGVSMLTLALILYAVTGEVDRKSTRLNSSH